MDDRRIRLVDRDYQGGDLFPGGYERKGWEPTSGPGIFVYTLVSMVAAGAGLFGLLSVLSILANSMLGG